MFVYEINLFIVLLQVFSNNKKKATHQTGLLTVALPLSYSHDVTSPLYGFRCEYCTFRYTFFFSVVVVVVDVVAAAALLHVRVRVRFHMGAL